MIAIIDSGISNVASVLNMMRKIGVPARLARSPSDLESAERIILPGVGHFETGMKRLEELELVESIRAASEQRKPILGICLGMQLLLKNSEEGGRSGLGLVDGHCIRFKPAEMRSSLPVPHMGWRQVTPLKTSQLLHGLPEESRFYFVHSYHAKLVHKNEALFSADYGYEFTAGYESANIAGVQFHPEKSHKFGEQLLRNFARWPVA